MTTKVPVAMQSGAGRPAMQAAASPVSIPTGLGSATAFTAYSAPAFDETAAFNATTGRFTPQVPGLYQINAEVGYDTDGIAALVVHGEIRKNGTVVGRNTTSMDALGYPRLCVSTLVELNGSTDYVDLSTRHNASGAATNVVALLSAVLVSP